MIGIEGIEAMSFRYCVKDFPSIVTLMPVPSFLELMVRREKRSGGERIFYGRKEGGAEEGGEWGNSGSPLGIRGKGEAEEGGRLDDRSRYSSWGTNCHLRLATVKSATCY